MSNAQVRWTEHVTRMANNGIPKQLFYRELCQSKRKVGGQRKRFKNTLKTSLKDLLIDADAWESAASDRPTRRGLI